MQTLREHFPQLTIYPLSEKAITLQFGNSISADLLAQVTTVNQLILETPFQKKGEEATVLNPTLFIRGEK